jgi:hypothetical protein
MNHTRTIRLPGVTVWSEFAGPNRERYYAQAQQPTTLPMVHYNPTDPNPRIGVSAMAFSNPDGTLVATKSDNMPSSLWIWSLKLLRPYAVLVHINPIKSFTWHPSIPDLLMIQCASDGGDNTPDSSGMLYLWSSSWLQPRAIQVPMEKVVGASWAKWVVTPRPRSQNSSIASTSPQPYTGRIDRRSNSPGDDFDKRPMILFGDREGFTVGYVEDEPVPQEAADQEGRNWGNVDWDYYSISRDIPKRTSSAASQHSTLSIPGAHFYDINKSRGGLGAVSESTSGPPSAQKETDDTFEYRLGRKQSVSVHT